MESTTSTEDSIRNGDLVSRPAAEVTCSVTYEAPNRDRSVVAVDEVVSDTVVKANGEGRDREAVVVRAETDTSVDSRGTLVEYFLSVSDAEATYDSEDSKEYFLEH